eukprot:TRINITY_DN87999_c0_g1_i1.p1 TRINITY_DN87999_c0_g1~~TRINITY_DN87999_c0_g1_i1.p1  ORF type:complete len:1243 (-),score=226.32 TRINITY_DN87999_c0_g1_i1:28-3756(-)
MVQSTEAELRELLQVARPDWRRKDVEAVEAKLARAGITCIPELALALRGKSLNDALEKNGEKRFAADTLRALRMVTQSRVDTVPQPLAAMAQRDTSDSITKDCHRVHFSRGRCSRRLSRQRCGRGDSTCSTRTPSTARETSQMDPQGSHSPRSISRSRSRPSGSGPRSLHCQPVTPTWPEHQEVAPSWLNFGDEERKHGRQARSRKAGLSGLRGAFRGEELPPKQLQRFKAFENDTTANLRNECKLRGIAPPSLASREDLLSSLRVCLAWETSSRTELLRSCHRRSLEVGKGWTQDQLLQHLKDSTWASRDIPVQRLQNMTVACGLLDRLDWFEAMSLPELVGECHRKGLPVEAQPDRPGLLKRLHLLIVWEHLPTSALREECLAHGLISAEEHFEAEIPLHRSPFMFSVGFCESQELEERLRLLKLLVRELYLEVFALEQQFEEQQHIQGQESLQPPEALPLAPGGDDLWLCRDCSRQLHHVSETILVDEHKCCVDCALKIGAQRAQTAEEQDEEEVLEWLCKWRACRDTVFEPAPEPTLLATSEGEEATEAEGTALKEETEPEEEGALVRQEATKPGESPGLVSWSEHGAAADGQPVKTRAEPLEQQHCMPPCSLDLLHDSLSRQDPGMPASPIPSKQVLPFEPVFAPAPALGMIDIYQVKHDTTSSTTPKHTSTTRSTATQTSWKQPDHTVSDKPEVAVTAQDPAQSSALRVRFLYASPLLLGNELRPLDIPADVEALRTGGIHVELRVGTAEAMREALTSLCSPPIIHLSAHCLTSGGFATIILETPKGTPHPLRPADFAGLGWWGRVELLVLLACSSQGFAQSLMANHALRRVICCSAVVLDPVVHTFSRTFYRALGAGHALAWSFEAAKASIRASADPALRGEAGKFVLLGEPSSSAEGGRPWKPVPTIRYRVPLPPWPQRLPQVEDYLGRELMALSLVNLFEGRRVVCLWAGPGSGKTALCTEFCRHFAAPGGRRFSAGAFLVDWEKVSGEASLPRVLLLELQRQQSSVSAASLVPSAVEFHDPAMLLEKLVLELDRAGPWLLVLDGIPLGDADRPGLKHTLFTKMLKETVNLHLLLTTRSAPSGRWASLGPSKVVQTQLPELSLEDSARLLARRARRPFFRCDFDEAYGCERYHHSVPLRLNEELLALLALSPLCRLLAGNPGNILSAAAEVHPGLPSLLQHPWLEKSSASDIPSDIGALERPRSGRLSLKVPVLRPVAMGPALREAATPLEDE